MLELEYQTKFRKQLELCKSRGKDIAKLNDLVILLRKGIKLPPKNKNHPLHGKYDGCWECHIEPNWLLIYIKTKTHLILSRTGTHSDLFK